MSTYKPGSYGWVAPLFETKVTDEPDEAQASLGAIYDPVVGRLGSTINCTLQGADDDTTFAVHGRTEFWVPIAVGPNTSGLSVTARFRCEDWSFRNPVHDDDSGSSSYLAIIAKSTPYAALDAQKPGARVYAADPDLLSYQFRDQEDNDPVRIGFKIEPLVGDLRIVNFRLTEHSPKRGDRVRIGIEDHLFVGADDFTFEAGMTNNWILEQLDIEPF